MRLSSIPAVRNVLIYGLCGGLLFAVLRLTEYRFLVLEHSVEIYGGWWLPFRRRRHLAGDYAHPQEGRGRRQGSAGARGRTVRARRGTPARAGGIAPRELEILGVIAGGLSNREIAERLFVSENAVRTHSRRLFDKLRAQRRTQAVQLGQAARLIP